MHPQNRFNRREKEKITQFRGITGARWGHVPSCCYLLGSFTAAAAIDASAAAVSKASGSANIALALLKQANKGFNTVLCHV